MKRSTAIVVESSTDGGKTWDHDFIAWSSIEAAKLAREIPWLWRMRRVELHQGEILSGEETSKAIEEQRKLETIFGP